MRPLVLIILCVSMFLSPTCLAGSDADQSDGFTTRRREGRVASYDWLVGRWEWRRKEQHGDVPLPLLNVEYLAVYPYCDTYLTDYLLVAAELVGRGVDGSWRHVSRQGYQLRLTSERMFFGSAVGILLDYSHGNESGTEWLDLRWKNDTGDASFTVRLIKVADDPGPSIHGEPGDEALKAVSPDFAEDSEQYQTRRRKRSTAQPVEPGNRRQPSRH